jgi:RND family efflux transporter MFP subunit
MTDGWKKPVSLAAGAALLIVLIASGWALWGGRAPSGLPANSAIRVQAVGRADFTQTSPWLGTVESQGAVTLVSTAAGRVLAVLAQDGAHVREGQPVFRLGGPLLDPQLASARARETALAQELVLARQVALRQEEAARLKVVDENVPAAAQAEVQKLEAALCEAQAKRASLEAAATVRAPVAGVFTDRRVNPGQDVGTGALLAEVTDPGRLRVAATLYVAASVPLQGLPATVSLGDRSANLTVARVFPDQNAAGGTLLWLEGKGMEGLVKPGARVSGTVDVANHRGVLAVPPGAVVYDDEERPYVFVERGGACVKTTVVLGLASPRAVEVKEGLKEGDRVVVEGAYELYYKDFGKTYQVED